MTLATSVCNDNDRLSGTKMKRKLQFCGPGIDIHTVINDQVRKEKAGRGCGHLWERWSSCWLWQMLNSNKPSILQMCFFPPPLCVFQYLDRSGPYLLLHLVLSGLTIYVVWHHQTGSRDEMCPRSPPLRTNAHKLVPNFIPSEAAFIFDYLKPQTLNKKEPLNLAEISKTVASPCTRH